jgi:NAD-dependent SIR2 family protein deacetylase
VILNESLQRRKDIGGDVKTIRRAKIIIETREVLLVRGELFQGRCAECGERVEMVRLQDTNGCANAPEKANRPHLIESGNGLRFICLNSLLK